MSIKPRQDQLLFYHMYKKIDSSVPSKEEGRENDEKKQGPNYKIFYCIKICSYLVLLHQGQWLLDF